MKLTPTVASRIVTIVETTHLPLCRIASHCKITYQTLRNWLRDGEDYQKQIEDGKIKKGDLTTNQKRKLDLYLRVGLARTNKEVGHLQKIHEIAEKKEDIKAFQWLLRTQAPVYRDAHIEEDGSAASKSLQVIVVNLSDRGGPEAQLLSEFMHGPVKDGEKKEGDTKDTSDSDQS